MTGTLPGSSPEASSGALQGVRIADFGRVLAAPYATMLLADLGAEVVKVERPDGGDETRAWGPPCQAEARELIGTCDVLVENLAS